MLSNCHHFNIRQGQIKLWSPAPPFQVSMFASVGTQQPAGTEVSEVRSKLLEFPALALEFYIFFFSYLVSVFDDVDVRTLHEIVRSSSPTRLD